MKCFLALLFSVLISLGTFAQEICDNAIDDDGNGLIDLQDPTCACHFQAQGNLLLNPSFEAFAHCLPPDGTSDIHIMDYWQYGVFPTGAIYYYHNLSCPADSADIAYNFPAVFPIPDGKGFVSIGQASTDAGQASEKYLNKDYIAQCLQTPLKAGLSYVLTFYAARVNGRQDGGVVSDKTNPNDVPFTVAVLAMLIVVQFLSEEILHMAAAVQHIIRDGYSWAALLLSATADGCRLKLISPFLKTSMLLK